MCVKVKPSCALTKLVRFKNVHVVETLSKCTYICIYIFIYICAWSSKRSRIVRDRPSEPAATPRRFQQCCWRNFSWLVRRARRRQHTVTFTKDGVTVENIPVFQGLLQGGGVLITAPSCFFSFFSNFTFVSTSKPLPCPMSMLKSF